MTDSEEHAVARVRAQIEQAKTERFSKEPDAISGMTDAELDREIAMIESGSKEGPHTSKDDPRVMEVFNRIREDVLSAYGSRTELKPCPCGKTPTKIEAIRDYPSSDGRASGDCCGDWIVEFNTRHEKDDDKLEALAINAWNSAPRG